MNRDDIIRMAREAGFEHIAEADYWHPYFERFAAQVALAEREACARVCDALVKATHPNEEQVGPGSCAAAIRARGDA